MPDPKITDNDAGEITASVSGKEIRGWSYKDDAERRIKMLAAQEFAEGWFQAQNQLKRRVDFLLNEQNQLKRRVDFLLNEQLCCMEPDYDDSITGFNEAWNIVRKILSEEAFAAA